MKCDEIHEYYLNIHAHAPRLFDSLCENTQSIMQTSLGFVQEMRGSASQDNGARRPTLAAGETNEAIFTDLYEGKERKGEG
jgi:hypothetical protein